MNQHLLSGIALCLSCLPAQQVENDLRAAIADLASASRQSAAATILVRAGDAALPWVRAVVQDVEQRDGETARMALFVLGALGRRATAALPELLHAYRMGVQPEVRYQALWAIGQVAPFASMPSAEVMTFLRQHAAEQLDVFLWRKVEWRLYLGADPEEATLLEAMTRRDAAAIGAAAEAFVPIDPAKSSRMRALLDTFTAFLADHAARPDHPWDRNHRLDAAIGPVAAALWAAGQRGSLVGRGLLQHWDPQLRCAGLAELHDSGALTRMERLDVVGRLWDIDPSVRDLALATMRGWRAGFASAVPVLLSLQAGTDRAFAAAAKVACERWVRDGLAGPEARASAIATAAVATLRGDANVELAPAKTTVDDVRTFADVVLGCRGLSNGELPKLARFARQHDLFHEPVVAAFVSCLAAQDLRAFADTIEALAELGPRVLVSQPDIAVLMLRAEPPIAHDPVVFAEAWIAAGKTATADELARALRSERWTIAQRAAAEIVRRGAAPTPAMVDAAFAMRQSSFSDYVVAQGMEWSRLRGHGYACTTMQGNPARLRAAATLVLLAADDERWRASDAVAACAEVLGLEAERAAEALASARAAGRLAEFATRLDETLSHPVLRMSQR